MSSNPNALEQNLGIKKHDELDRKIDRALGNALSREKRLDEARFHFEESLHCYEGLLRNYPADYEARYGQMLTLHSFARLAEGDVFGKLVLTA